MPQALPLLAPLAFQAGAGIGVTNALLGIGVAGAITHFVVGAAFAIGLSYIANKLLAPKATGGPSTQQMEVREPTPPLRVIYGRLLVGCPLAFCRSHFSTLEGIGNIGVYTRICLIAGHEIDEIEKHYLNGHEAILDEDGEEGDLHNGNAHIHWKLGTATQTADDYMITHWSDLWTTAHRGRGIAYAELSLFSPDLNGDEYIRAFPTGPPDYTALVRGKKVYDPTKDSTNGGTGAHRMNDPATWQWTDEQRLILLDFLTQPLGYGKGFGIIDWPSWRSQILLGREAVPLKGGGTEKRYRCSIAYHPAEDSKTDILNRIALAGDARLFFTSTGTVGCAGGYWFAPTKSLDLGVAGIDAEFGRPDRMDSYNIMHAKYLSPAHKYVEQEMDPWRDEARITAEGIERSREIDLTHVPSHAQARRLAKIYMYRDNPAWSGTARTKLHGLEMIGEQVVQLTFPEFDAGTNDFDGPFWIEGEITLDIATECVTLPLKRATAAAYSWSAASEEGTAPIVPPTDMDGVETVEPAEAMSPPEEETALAA